MYLVKVYYRDKLVSEAAAPSKYSAKQMAKRIEIKNEEYDVRIEKDV